MKRMSSLFALAPVTLTFLKEFLKRVSSRSMQLVQIKCPGITRWAQYTLAALVIPQELDLV